MPKPQAKVLSTYELMALFPNEQAAINYLAGILWPNGPVCPYCGGNRIANRPGNYHRCKDCRKDFTIRVGTIFERSHIPLHKWLYAMYMIVTSRKGVSSLQLSKELGITQNRPGSSNSGFGPLAATRRRKSLTESSKSTKRISAVWKRTSTPTGNSGKVGARSVKRRSSGCGTGLAGMSWRRSSIRRTPRPCRARSKRPLLAVLWFAPTNTRVIPV